MTSSSSTELSGTLQLACELIQKASVTPEDAGCQTLMISRLEACGFQVHPLPFENVKNFWAVRGNSGPIFCFAGHTDVVPSGPEEDWQTPPFSPVIDNGILYGRGAADMKGSLAAMVTAVESFVAENPTHQGQVAFLITSDEEGVAINGTAKVVEWLKQQGIKPDWCLVGEPSSSESIGDVVKNGRRGSLGCDITIKGLQGHVAYPQRAKNPIHLAAPAIHALTSEVWDEGNEFFPATSFQISNIQSGTGANNVIPGELTLVANFRFSTEVTADELKARTMAILNSHQLDFDIDWYLNGEPFLTDAGLLVDACQTAIKEIAGVNTELSTAGGTSDGRFIAPMGTQVVELGPVNATIHKLDEHVLASDLDKLKTIYQTILEKLLLP